MSGQTCVSLGQAACHHVRPHCRRAVRRAFCSISLCNTKQGSFSARLLACTPAQLHSAARCGRHSSQNSRCHCVNNSEKQQLAQQQVQRWLSHVPLHIIAMIAAFMSLSGPAWAELQTVPSSQATQYAKPIQKQKVDKGFVALLFAGGAAALFGSAVLLEKNSRFFPAIYKANQVMREAEKRNQGRAIAEQAVVDLEQQDDMRLQRSVEAGLANAQARVLPESSSEASNTSSSDTGRGTSANDGTSDAGKAQSASNATDQIGQTTHDKDSTSNSDLRPATGSQLSAADKSESAVNSTS